MKISKNGLQLLQKWEGSESHVYRDSGGAPTIGVGHLLTRAELRSGKILINGKPVKYAGGLSAYDITELLAQDLQPAEAAVSDNVKVELTQNQFDALVSFTFNVGVIAFAGSTLLKVLNAGLYLSVPAQLARWIYDGGVRVKGLVTRRKREAELWLKA